VDGARAKEPIAALEAARAAIAHASGEPQSGLRPGTLPWASAVGNRAVQRLARRNLMRMTAAEIRQNYQVKEDKVVEDWVPSVGPIPLLFLDGHKITRTEADLLDDLELGMLYWFKSIAEDAFKQAITWIPGPPSIPAYVPADRENEWKGNDGHRDAFRHCYWNVRLADVFGQKWAKTYCTAHEALPDNSASREAMDLYNNEVGRQIQKDNPDLPALGYQTLVKRAIDGGKLVVIDHAGDLQWSTDVGLWDHGLSDGSTLPGVIKAPKKSDAS
jgi:hypothetical protein